ncbi:O-antigen polysaccharide polymerase Wzy [Halosimplex carlsbadense]|uniref:O-antigen polysaccharide polymerase Wzy n=1 Tax=Halosimplex carlsbadense TaxID=171164 RepID=UPI0012696C0A|nr:O-antigen polysaccharide polymerase Wzy [Halosimplex carlsbadense]
MVVYTKFAKVNDGRAAFYHSPVLLLAFFVNNPISTPRYYALNIIFGICLLVLIKYLSTGWAPFSILMVALPGAQIVDAFRYAESFSDVVRSVALSPFSYILSQTFDAHENISHTIHYTDEVGFEMGSQLIGGLSFFIPRTVWPNKPVGSGIFISNWLGTQGHTVLNTNIGVPFLAESYLNFGILGILGMGILTGAGIQIFDRRLDISIGRHVDNSDSVDLWLQLGVFSTGNLLLFFRGSFLSATSYLSLFVLAWISMVMLVEIVRWR